MATTATSNPFAGTGDVTGYITGGARRGSDWDFMDQRGNVLTTVPYDTFVNQYQSDGSGAVRSGITSVNGVPVYNFSGGAPALASSASNSSDFARTSMATSNPFDVTTGGSGGIVGGAITPGSAGEAAQFSPQTRQVSRATETAAGQIESLLASDSPLLQRARTQALQSMNERGLVNSSMAQGAGVAAMIDRVTPLAQQDAQTYAQRASENMQAVNQGGLFNVGEQNKFGLQKSDQAFDERQAQLAREFTTGERVGAQQFQADQAANLQAFQATQAEKDRAQQILMADKSLTAQQALERARQEFERGESALNRAQQTALQQADAAFRATQAQLDRQQQEAMTRLQNSLSQSNVSSTFAANIVANTSGAINAVMADPNLTPEAKRGAIDNIIAGANSSLQWGASFYNTALPTMSPPGTSAGVVNPAPGIARPSAPAPTAPQIAAVYQELLGRAPDDQGLRTWMNSGMSLDQIRQEIARSEEAIRRATTTAAPATRATTTAPATQAASAAPAPATQAASAAPAPEPAAAPPGYGGALGSQIQAMYEQYLGRPAAASEVDYYYNAIVNSGNTTTGVAHAIQSSPEFQSRK